MKPIVFSLVAILLIATIVFAEPIAVSRFESEGLAGWQSKSFKGMTDYHLVKEDHRTTIKAHSRNAASGLFKKVNLEAGQYRYLQWKWKIDAPLGHAAEKTKGGDDYAARVYVIFPGFFFWQMKAINYVWANRLPKGESFANPYTGNAMMVVVESGRELAGTWVSEQRDIVADYRRLFGKEPGRLGAVAIMTDTDNTGGEATAWYGDITLVTTLPEMR